MKEVKLTSNDITFIKDIAHTNFINSSIDFRNSNNFVCSCYIEAIINYISNKGYIIKDGKLYEKVTNTTS